ncbi:uncharacterized protein LOC117180364 isoform X2 [Belonocnema kinseyi]|uniref:uncharacterized protein LOC117180364 isoform X2 n=1 Tax=Belonocnema kinseyi TaxID=2817044 RepID=UPI00143DC290|nr:uncharacterized protein LOC117180364 isoform X2 [Belonocnema kinseyi]
MSKIVLNRQKKEDKMKCFVPGCENRSRGKSRLFFGIPRDPVLKNAWYTKVGYPKECARKASAICCEDHFDLPEDMENYMRYRFVGGNKRLKKGVLPRFNLPKSNKQNSAERLDIIKMELDIPEANILNQMDGTVVIKSEPDGPNVETLLSQNMMTEINRNVIKTESDSQGSDPILSQAMLGQMDGSVVIKAESELSESNILNQMDQTVVIKTEPDLLESEFHLSEASANQMDHCIFIKMEPDSPEEQELRIPEINMLCQVATSPGRGEIFQPYSPNKKNVGINQRNKSSGAIYRQTLPNKSQGLKFPYILDEDNRGTNPSEPPTDEALLHGINHDFKHMFTSSSGETETSFKNTCIQTNLRPKVRSKGLTCKPSTRDVATSPIRRELKRTKVLITEEDWLSEASHSEDEEVRIEILKNRMFETRTKAFIENDPLLFLGLPKSAMHLIASMEKRLNIPILHIYCVLKKIRLNLSNEVLSYDFGLSYSHISHIFKKTVPLIARYLKKYILWPEENLISANLPVQFRNRLKKVQSILHIFEVKMERSNLIQGLRLPSYESTETARFLVSSTPNGFITFVSTRYCKGNADVTIVKNSGFLDILPEDVAILSLADRGFKYVDNVLKEKNCRLIRVPSISMRRNWKAETKIYRWLASVRIHVKRLMNQLRDFKILENSVNFGNRSESLLDDIVIIAAALINIQLTVGVEEGVV